MRSVIKLLPGALLAVLALGAVAPAAWASGKPLVETQPARSVGTTEALLNGGVDPNGAETKYDFEYGTTVAYGKKTTEVSVGAGTKVLEESKAIAGLTASTTYHFRIVAKNSNGTSDGADEVFTTLTEESGCHVKPGSKKYGLCVEGTSTTAAPIEHKQTPAGEQLRIALLASDPSYATIVCGKLSTVGELTGAESIAFKEELTVTECGLSGEYKTSCTVAQPGFVPTQGVFGNNPEDITFKPVSGTEFFTPEFNNREGHCALEGKFPVVGMYECKLSTPEAEQIQHKEVCVSEQLEWKGSHAAIEYYVNVLLTGSQTGHKFSIYEH
jgi:hypothetical protein